MILVKSRRSRKTFFRATFAAAISLCLLFSHQITAASAAKRAILAEDSRITSQLASGSQHSEPSPVLVELFTSEGCSSCPPADALLAHLDRDQPVPNVNIIVLEEHVDYWDHLGWKDRFSSPYITQRQQQYQTFFNLDDVYTPQTVVNGETQFNGTDSSAITNAIKAAATKTVPLHFTGVEIHGQSVTFTLQNGPATHSEFVNVYAALVDPADTTEVLAGENHGRTLRHAGVVRTFTLVGSAWHMKNLGEHSFLIQTKTPTDLNGMRLVVFAQIKHVGSVLGIASCSLVSPTPAIAQTSFPANRCPAPSI